MMTLSATFDGQALNDSTTIDLTTYPSQNIITEDSLPGNSLMSPSAPALKQELMLHLETLPERQLSEALNFIKFLLFKDNLVQTATMVKKTSPSNILVALTQIRETVHQTYGEYQGDLVAEARLERQLQFLDSP